MKVFPVSVIREIDSYTIENEPVLSVDLMERAATVLSERIIQLYPESDFSVFAGPGNNGGDALFVALKLLNRGFKVNVWLYYIDQLSTDCDQARERLIVNYPESITEIPRDFKPATIAVSDVIIDGLFGSGLNRKPEGFFAEIIDWINFLPNIKIALDVPSGLFGENVSMDNVLKVNYTLALQFPKLSFFFAEHADIIGIWEVLDIKLHSEAIQTYQTNYYYQKAENLIRILKKRDKFSHKGTFGNVLLIAGKNGMAGASVLAAKAVLKSGAGLVYVSGPSCNRVIVQTALPESIFIDSGENEITGLPEFSKYDILAFGPGVGTGVGTLKVLEEILYSALFPLVIDADGLNIISENPYLLDLIPPESILTPHPGEFDRLFGKSVSSEGRLKKLQEAAIEKQLYIILKGANTAIACPDGKVIFNSTGNSGLSTAGSGDVLTGLIAGFIAQKYSLCEAAQLAVYLHGLSADLALDSQTEETFIASDIFTFLPNAFMCLRKS